MAPLRARAGYFRLYGAGRTTVLPSIVTAPATSAAPASALPFSTVPLTVDQITTNNVPGALAFLKAHGC